MNTKDMEIIFSNQDIQDIQSRNNKLIERLLGQSFASNIETSFNNLNSAVLSLHSSFVTDQSSFHKSTEHLNKLKRHRYEVMCLTDNLKPIIAHKEKSRKLYSVNAINCYLLEPELELSLILTEKGCNDVKIMVNVRYLADNTLLSQENNKFLDLIKEYEFFADRDIINQVENGKKFDPYDYNSLVSVIIS